MEGDGRPLGSDITHAYTGRKTLVSMKEALQSLALTKKRGVKLICVKVNYVGRRASLQSLAQAGTEDIYIDMQDTISEAILLAQRAGKVSDPRI